MMLPRIFISILSIIITINVKPIIAQDVIPSITLCHQERMFTSTRKPFNHTAIERILGHTCAQTPTIALCLSGGGYRAMISSLGFLIAAQQLGIIDAAEYIAGLSGGTWLVGPLLAYNHTDPATTEYLQRYRNYLKTAVSKPFFSGLKVEAIEAMLLQKHAQGQAIQFVDIWGAIIANNLLGHLDACGQKVYLSQCATAPTAFPFPLFNAVIGKMPPYQWLEASPYHVESDYLHAQVPLQLFGNHFSANVAQTHWPEQQLGYYLGIFGSPYAFSIGDILRAIAEDIKNPALRAIILTIADWHILYPEKFEPATPSNYTYKLTPPVSPLENEQTTTLIDAGFDFNLPLPSLLNPQRAINIIFICDASSDASLDFYPQLRMAENYARTHGLKFPSIEAPVYKNAQLLIFKSADPSVPTVVYIPNKINDSTLKLQYSEKEFEALCSYMENALLFNKETIVNVIRERAIQGPSMPPTYTIHPIAPPASMGFVSLQIPLMIQHHEEEESEAPCCGCFD